MRWLAGSDVSVGVRVRKEKRGGRGGNGGEERGGVEEKRGEEETVERGGEAEGKCWRGEE